MLYYEADQTIGYAYYIPGVDVLFVSLGELRLLSYYVSCSVPWFLAWLIFAARQRRLPDPGIGDFDIHIQHGIWGMTYHPTKAVLRHFHIDTLEEAKFAVYESEDRSIDNQVIHYDYQGDYLRQSGDDLIPPEFPEHLLRYRLP